MSEPVRIEEIDQAGLERLLERVKPLLAAEDYALVEKIVKSLFWLTGLVKKRGTTIARLRRLVGLSGSEKTAAVLAAKAPFGSGPEEPPEPPAPGGAGGGGPDADRSAAPAAGETAQSGADTAPKAQAEKAKVKGHGRVPGSAYRTAKHIAVKHESLCPGEPCPGCGRGTLFALERPAQFLRIIGQAPLYAVCWNCQRLRCSGCGAVYTARAPAEAQGDKYTETAVSMMALMRYGIGVPHHRLEQFQSNLHTPVPSSTQWDVIDKRVSVFESVYSELIRQAAQGLVLYIDDTHARILELMGKRRAALLQSGKLDDPERTGLHTTAVVSSTERGQKIAVFVTSRQHAGENLSDLLDLRAPLLPPPIKMSDALACNNPTGHDVLACNCLVHGRRNFVDEIESFPHECRYLLERIGRVFKTDETCRQQKLSPEERLLVHQRQSGPIMEELKTWMRAQFDEKRVEPNSGMGKAINYMLKRWDKFTLFLRLPGAPLENNTAERALKMAIRHRNNSLFFRTQHGADVGDIYMTLIYTTELHGENPFEYLTALQLYEREVEKTPADWLPWNWRDTLRSRAEHQAPDPQLIAA